MDPLKTFGVEDLSDYTLSAFKSGYVAGSRGIGQSVFRSDHINSQAWELGYRIGLRDAMLGGSTVPNRRGY